MPREDMDITRRTHWHSQKRGRNLSITDEGWKLLGELARHVGNRSEAIEVMARYISASDTDLAKKRDKMLLDQSEYAIAKKADEIIEETVRGEAVQRRKNYEAARSADSYPYKRGGSSEGEDTCGVDLSACTFEPPTQAADTPAECSIS